MKNILLGLQTSYKTTSDEAELGHRAAWIRNGLNSLSIIDDFITKCDCYYMDNTVNQEDELPDFVRNVIPKSAERVYSTEANHYGTINKGAGVIEMMQYVKDKIKNYEWYVHHEPRTVIRHSGMFDSFLSEPSNLFKVGSPANPNENSFWTGTFFIHTKNLIDYLDRVDLDTLCNESISIEFHIRNFIESRSIPYRSVDDAGIIWNDVAAGINYFV